MTGIASPHRIVQGGQPQAAVAHERVLMTDDTERLAPARYARLLIATVGTVAINDDAAFILSGERALWLPAGRGCHLLSRTDARLCIVVFEQPVAAMPTVSRLLDLPPLVRALAAELNAAGRRRCGIGDREAALISLLGEELGELPEAPGRVTLPHDLRLRRVCEAIIARPADDRGIDEWSREAGMARRTFTRLFRDETGMAFANWRRRLRLSEAAQRLAAGQPIGRVAYDLGYDSSSAFTAMFRRTLGVPPRAYLRRA